MFRRRAVGGTSPEPSAQTPPPSSSSSPLNPPPLSASPDGDGDGAASISPVGACPNSFDFEHNRNTDWLRHDNTCGSPARRRALSQGGGATISSPVSTFVQPGFAFAAVYAILVLLANLLFITNPLLHVEASLSWTAVNVLHGLVTVRLMHWIKGSPDFFSQGEMNGLTFWEQLDVGDPFSPKKRTLMAIPTLLCLVACASCDYDALPTALNVATWTVCIFAKMPFMVGVRILGINSTAGIDR
mmetsp:Transcript_24010/g.54621  ORF Transcript_24010/g.54621 Transcript_24010/m.54621 type:complete len:243 (-) Transcript_24010:211-939(-)